MYPSEQERGRVWLQVEGYFRPREYTIVGRMAHSCMFAAFGQCVYTFTAFLKGFYLSAYTYSKWAAYEYRFQLTAPQKPSSPTSRLAFGEVALVEVGAPAPALGADDAGDGLVGPALVSKSTDLRAPFLDVIV